jgi:hypothetical protein
MKTHVSSQSFNTIVPKTFFRKTNTRKLTTFLIGLKSSDNLILFYVFQNSNTSASETAKVHTFVKRSFKIGFTNFNATHHCSCSQTAPAPRVIWPNQTVAIPVTTVVPGEATLKSIWKLAIPRLF